jgi:hypothetical protein
MTTNTRKQVRLLLEPNIEFRVVEAARKEGRTIPQMCNRLISEALNTRSLEGHKLSKLAQMIKGEA